jgi:hypothetical protein
MRGSGSSISFSELSELFHVGFQDIHCTAGRESTPHILSRTPKYYITGDANMKTRITGSIILVALLPVLGFVGVTDVTTASGAMTTTSDVATELRTFPPLRTFSKRGVLTEAATRFNPTLARCLPVPTPQREAGVLVSADEVKAVIMRYKVDNAVAPVTTYIQQMPAPVRNEEFRRLVHASLPGEFISHQVDDPRLTLATRRAFAPVLDLYSRTNVYDIVLLNYSVPLIMSDSGVLLCLTTGLLRWVQTEDELLGYVAHEVGHEWLVRKTVELKNQYESYLARGADRQAKIVMEKLALIELEADSFASQTLAYLEKTPVEYVRSLQRSAIEYGDIPIGYHPSASQRAQVITSLVPQRILNLTPRKTCEFVALKEALAKSRKR